MKLVTLGLVVSTALMTGQVVAADGKEIYNKSCALCHTAIHPKLTDKAAWVPRLKQGNDHMVAAVIKGKGSMPPKGGAPNLTEAEIKAAVEYMMERVK